MDRQKYGQTEIWTDRNMDRQRFGQTEIWTDRDMNIQSDRENERQSHR